MSAARTFAVMAHVNGPDAVRSALEAGTDSIEHGYYMDEACLALLAETFCISPKAPFSPVKALQAAFDPAGLAFSEEYYDVLGLEPPAPSL